MTGPTVIYDNRVIPKAGFRAFIYGANGETKLVNSWEEFEAYVQTGVWFPNMEALNAATDKKPKKKGD